MTCFASIHTAHPSSQCDNEGAYKGYRRVPLDCAVGALYIRSVFPEVQEDTDSVMTHIAIGADEEGDGEVFLSLKCEPCIPLKIMQPGKSPNIIITYPDTLAKSARIIHQLVAMGRIKANEIEPLFFESVNDNLNAHGIPILTVTRTGSAGWIGKLSQMPSFNRSN